MYRTMYRTTNQTIWNQTTYRTTYQTMYPTNAYYILTLASGHIPTTQIVVTPPLWKFVKRGGVSPFSRFWVRFERSQKLSRNIAQKEFTLSSPLSYFVMPKNCDTTCDTLSHKNRCCEFDRNAGLWGNFIDSGRSLIFIFNPSFGGGIFLSAGLVTKKEGIYCNA